MSDNVSIEGLEKADVIVALYNASRTQGLGFLQEAQGRGFTREDAERRLADGHDYFDYVEGRVVKVDLSGAESFNPALYDRDLGEGAAQRAIDTLREG